MYLLTSIFQNPEEMIDIIQSSLLPMLKGALYYSIPLTLISFTLGMVLAIVTALARLSDVSVLRGIARFYVSAIRGTPLLVQLFIIFYGLGSLGIEWLKFDPFPSAIIAFSLNMGAYSSEIVRAAISSIPKGQWEAGYSIGMTYSSSPEENYFTASNKSIYTAIIEFFYKLGEGYITCFLNPCDRNV